MRGSYSAPERCGSRHALDAYAAGVALYLCEGVVDTEQLFPTVDQFSDLAIGRDGTVYVSWMRCTANEPTGDCGGTTATSLLSKSTDGGNIWRSAGSPSVGIRSGRPATG
jgi:hypothetical protein